MDWDRIAGETGLALNWDFKPDRIRQQIWTAFPVDRADPQQLDASRHRIIGAAKRLRDAFESRLKAVHQAGSSEEVASAPG